MKYQSQKNIFSPVMSKNLSGVPLILHGRQFKMEEEQFNNFYRMLWHFMFVDSIKGKKCLFFCLFTTSAEE
jgi:hypothetical protein